MALAVLLRTEQFLLATDRAVLTREETGAIENAVDLLEAAVAEAEHLRTQAEQAARRIAERARQEAQQHVRDEVARACAAAPVSAAHTLRDLEQAMAEIVTEAVLRLAGDIDRRQLLARAIAEVTRLASERRFATLKVAPSDLLFAQLHVAELTQAARLPATLTVRADPALAPGDCVLVSDAGKLSTGLSQQLRALAFAVRQATAAAVAAPAAPIHADRATAHADDRAGAPSADHPTGQATGHASGHAGHAAGHATPHTAGAGAGAPARAHPPATAPQALESHDA
jgi:flagellar biosynthesis/type III secretory pathway protein FliH